MTATTEPPTTQSSATERKQIILPTLTGDDWELIPGITVELMRETANGKRRPMVSSGRIDQFKWDDCFRLTIKKKGFLPEDVFYFAVINFEGERWADPVPHGSTVDEDGAEIFSTLIPVVQQNNPITSVQSNALKLVTLTKDGVYHERTLTVVIQRRTAFLVQQYNYCEQVYVDDDGDAFLPRNRSKGKQPKRIGAEKLIEEEFGKMKDIPLPKWPAGKNFVETPTGAGLKGPTNENKGQARVLWWSAHRQTGGAVLHNGKQVRIFWNEIFTEKDADRYLDRELKDDATTSRGNSEPELKYLEPGTIVEYSNMVRPKGNTSFSGDLIEVTPI